MADQEKNEMTRYSDADLEEFRQIIQKKLDDARKELEYFQEEINTFDEGEDNKYMGLEDGANTLEKEYLSQMATRQQQFINHLENALVRIQNKTYGICRVTGKLIAKERLKAVPHATLSIEAKKAQKK